MSNQEYKSNVVGEKVVGEKIKSKQRRRVVGGTLAGTAALVWHKPLINSIVLPAHAQTSMVAPMTFFGAATPTSKSVASTVLDALIPQAHAGISVDPVSITASIEQTEVDGTEFMVTVLLDLGGSLSNRFDAVQLAYSGMLTLGVASTLSVSEDPCDIANVVFSSSLPDLSITLDSVNEDQAVLTGGNEFINSGTVSIPAGSGTLMSATCTETVEPTAFASFDFNARILDGNIETNEFNGFAKSLLDTVLPSAYAGQEVMVPSVFSATAILLDRDTDSYTVTLQDETRGIRWSGTVVASVGRSLVGAASLSLDRSASCAISIGMSDTQVDVSISEDRSLSLGGSGGNLIAIDLSGQSLGISERLLVDSTALDTPDFCLTLPD